MNRLRGFTLIELLVVISIIALLISILLPVIGKAQFTAQMTQNTTQLRGIHQGFVTYANDHKYLYPGLVQTRGTYNDRFTDEGDIDTITGGGGQTGRSTTARTAIALEDDLFPAELAISPVETNTDVKEWREDETYSYSNDHITSYAFNKFLEGGVDAHDNGRLQEWQATGNGRAIVIGDRAVEMGSWNNPETYQSLWSRGKPNWIGTVVFNDNSTFNSRDNTVEDTKYGKHRNTEPDDLFIGAYDKNVNKNGGDKANNCDLAVGAGGNELSATAATN